MDVKPEVKITFEDQPAVFFVGKEAINGGISISVTKLMKTQMIKVEFKGVCQVGWTKRGVSDRKDKSVEHFKIEDKLLTPRSEYNDLFLRPGTHRFPFSFKLPQAMPPTFAAKDAKIEYFATVVVHYRDDGSMVSNEICSEAPLVMKKSIANFPEKFLKSAKLKQQLTISKIFSRPIRIEVEAMIPKRVYHRGEILRLTCDYKILNGTVNSFTGICAVLMQGLTVVKANGRETTKTREILRAPPFQGHIEETTKWSDTYMNIPDDISLTVQGCGDITIFYFIQVRAKNSKERIDIPVVIIDRDESKIVNPGKRWERRLSLTGSTSAIPNVFQTFNALSRQDPKRESRTSIHSFYRD